MSKKPCKKVVVKNETHYVTAAEGFKNTIPEVAVLERHRVPLQGGGFYISFSGYFQSHNLKSKIGLAAFKDIGLIYRDADTDHWLPTDAGFSYFIAKPGTVNHFGIGTEALPELINDYQDRFINAYDAYAIGGKTLPSRVSPTVKLPVPDDVRESLYKYMEREDIDDFGKAISKLIRFSNENYVI